MIEILKSIYEDKISRLSILLFILLSTAWVFIFLIKTTDAPINHIYGFIYGGFSIWGAFWGLTAAKAWGGRKSLMGRAIISLSLGLFAQAFGQYSFWYYNFVLKIPDPYPSIPDIGYFGTIPLYIYAAILLAKASGVSVSLRSFINQIHAIIIPIIMLGISYLLFLRGYIFDWSNPLKVFLDFGYPMGQAIYVSIAILNYSLCRKILGGIMKSRIFLLLIAFFFQYLSDYIFVYFSNIYFPACFIDYFYLTAYFLMTVGLLQLKKVANILRSGS